MVAASCHCGAVTLEAPHPPAEITSCNCSICRRLGTLWAYYAVGEVRVAGETTTYVWGDKTIQFHRCAMCGCATHWSPIGPNGEYTGINARLMDPAIVAAARTRKLDGADTWKYLDE